MEPNQVFFGCYLLLPLAGPQWRAVGYAYTSKRIAILHTHSLLKGPIILSFLPLSQQVSVFSFSPAKTPPTQPQPLAVAWAPKGCWLSHVQLLACILFTSTLTLEIHFNLAGRHRVAYLYTQRQPPC